MPSQLTIIQALTGPKDVHGVRSVLGTIGYYQRFIHHYSDKATPMYALLKKNNVFQYTNKCEQAFQSLKQGFGGRPSLETS